MTIASRQSFWIWGGGSKVFQTFNMNGLSDSGLSIPINGMTDITICAFVMPVVASNWSYAVSPSWQESPGGWGGTYFGRNENTMEVRFGSGSSTSKMQFAYTVPSNEWHHYCFTRSTATGEYKFYLDGQFHSQVSGNSTSLQRNGTFYLTQGLNGSTIAYDISYVSYCAFSKALTANEVQEVYYAGGAIDIGKSPFNSGLVLGLPLTEGSGNEVHDVASGSSITLTGNVVWDVTFVTPERERVTELLALIHQQLSSMRMQWKEAA